MHISRHIFFAQILIKSVFTLSGSQLVLTDKPINIRANRVYQFKGQYMNRSNFCEIKYRIGLFFSKVRYMIGVGSIYWLVHPYQKYLRVTPILNVLDRNLMSFANV